MRISYPSQLLPFHGIQGFGDGTEYFNATVFLISPDKQGHLFGLMSPVDIETIANLLDHYAAEAEATLLFTDRVSRITYATCSVRSRGDTKCKWQLSRQSGITELPTNSISINSAVTMKYCEGFVRPTRTSWRISQGALSIWKKEYPQERDDPKLAIQIRSFDQQGESSFKGVIFNGQRFFPLERLPFHAQLLVDTDSGAEIHPLEKPLARAQVVFLYMELLAYLASEIGEAVYDFWPRMSSGEPVMDLLIEDFWKEATRSGLKLFLGMRAVRLKSDIVDKSLTFSFSDAIFDFTPCHSSHALQRVLSGFKVKNIVRPSNTISEALQLKEVITIKTVDANYIRSLLKLPDAASILQTIWEEDNLSCWTLNRVLEFVLDLQSRQDLVGCTCLPLLTGTLGTMKLGRNHGMGPDGSFHEASGDSARC
jgi:hypothetical protein